MTKETKPVVMITGAAGNLGSAVTRYYAEHDVRLFLWAHREGELSDRHPELSENPDHLLMEGVDLTEGEQVKQAVDQGLEKLTRIDVLVHTVGGFRMGQKVHELDAEIWDLMMGLNVQTLLNTVRAVVPQMLENKTGKIITIGARTSLEGKGKMGAYSAAKGAVLRLTESMAAELKGKGINVNCVLPGTIDTPENRQAMPDANVEKWVKPASLAEVIGFLASEKAADIHGAAVPVYGGS